MRKINQIFYSLQGEGFLYRQSRCFHPLFRMQPEMFVLRYRTRRRYIDVGRRDIGGNLRLLSRHLFILVGGGPALFSGRTSIYPTFSQRGKYICIETNGTRPLPKGIDWVTCSPKEGAPLKIDHMDEVKVVYLGQDLSSYIKLPAKYHFLQPCSCRNTMEIVNYILQHPEWQLSLQTHKLIDIA